MPREVQKCLLSQERKLNVKEKEQYLTNKLAENICVMTKRRKEDLLMFKSESFRLKKELNELVNTNSEHKETFFKTNRWISTLRRPNNFVGKSKFLYNSGTDNSPKWAYGVEEFPKINEYIRNPNSKLKSNKIDNLIQNKSLLKSFHDLDNETQIKFSNISGINVTLNI